MSVYAVFIIFLVSDVINKIDATSYVSLSSGDGNFNLQWTYNNSKLIFKMTCTTGWCAVGFTTAADGKNMVNYDIAVAGYASSAGYIDVSCIFVFIYLFGRGYFVRCFSKPLASEQDVTKTGNGERETGNGSLGTSVQREPA